MRLLSTTSMSNPPPTCILCRANPPIKNSHIVPAFVIRRLKKGSALDTLIHSDRLEKVFHDGWKGPYLCTVCEGKFSKLEDWFCKTVYDPFDRGALANFDYGPELVLFGASLIFRYLHFAIERNPGHRSTAALTPCYQNLRRSLLADDATAVLSSLYLDFFAPIITPDGFPPGINQYLFRAIDGKVQDWIVPGVATIWTVFVKLPGMNFVLSTFDLTLFQHRYAAIKQAVDLSGTMDTAFQRSSVFMQLYADDYRDRAVEVQANYGKLPSGRVQKMTDRITKSASIPHSHAEKAYLQDMSLQMAYEKLSVATALSA
jgi:hypothetical protein